jgi:hypothetical protein
MDTQSTMWKLMRVGMSIGIVMLGDSTGTPFIAPKGTSKIWGERQKFWTAKGRDGMRWVRGTPFGCDVPWVRLAVHHVAVEGHD